MAKLGTHLKISIPELEEMRHKALLDAEHWFSLVGKKSDVAGSLVDAEIELTSSIIQEDKTVESKTNEDSGMVSLPDETNDDGLEMDTDPAKPLIIEKESSSFQLLLLLELTVRILSSSAPSIRCDVMVSSAPLNPMAGGTGLKCGG